MVRSTESFSRKCSLSSPSSIQSVDTSFAGSPQQLRYEDGVTDEPEGGARDTLGASRTLAIAGPTSTMRDFGLNICDWRVQGG